MNKIEATAYLKTFIHPGDTIYTTVSHVARSGMSRHISMFVVIRGEIRSITRAVGQAIGYRLAVDSDTIIVKGCGMDMCFAVVYNLGRTLFPGGDGKTVTGRNSDTQPETDGGYLLKYRNL